MINGKSAPAGMPCAEVGSAFADAASGTPDPRLSTPLGYIVIPDGEAFATRFAAMVTWMISIVALIVVVWIVLDERKRHGGHYHSNHSCDSTTTRVKRRWFASPLLMAKSDGRLELLLTSAIFIVIEATNALGFTLFTSFPAVPVWPVYYTIRMLVFAPVAGMSLLIITLRVSALCFKSLALQERLWTVSAVTVAIITPCSIVGNLLSAPHVDWSRNAAEDFGTDWSSQLLLLINAVFPVAAGAMTVCSVHAALVPLFLAPGREETQSWWKRVCDAARGSRLLRLKSQQLPPSGPTVAMITTLHDHTVDNVGKGNSSIGVSMSSNTTQALSLSANTTRASASISASTNCAFASTSGVLTAAPAMPAPAVPTPAIAQPARLRSAHQIQSHLGFTFWLLTAAYVAGWAVLFLFHSLATVNLFLGMSISTLVTACCLIIESLFKLIVKARVTHRADVSNVTTRLKRSTDKSAGLEATDSTNHGDSITSMGQLAVSSWPTLAKLTAARRTSAGQETVHSVELSLARRRSSTTLAPRTDTARALSDGGQPGKKAKSVTAATSIGRLHALAEGDEIDVDFGEADEAVDPGHDVNECKPEPSGGSHCGTPTGETAGGAGKSSETDPNQ